MATRAIGTGSGGDGKSSTTIQIQITDGSLGNIPILLDILANANSQYDIRTVSLVNGDNTITVPTTAAGVILIAPPTNAVAWKTLGASGGTGIAQCLTGYQLMTFPVAGPPASFLIFTGGALVGFKIAFF